MEKLLKILNYKNETSSGENEVNLLLNIGIYVDC